MEKLSYEYFISCLFVDTENVQYTYIFLKGFSIHIIILIPFCSIVYTKEENELYSCRV